MVPLVGSEVARTRSKLALATRAGRPDQIAIARRDHSAAMIARYVAELVAVAPPMTEAQIQRIGALLRGSA